MPPSSSPSFPRSPSTLTLTPHPHSLISQAELQLFINSETTGEAMVAKWEEASRLHAARIHSEDLLPGGIWTGTGCFICKGFGDFVQDCLEDATSSCAEQLVH